jgi:sigma-B regulation protein RsbU (phosphoserine phosphatase)
MLPGLAYGAVNVALAPGARLIIYSDGITECANREGEEFGEARLAAFLGAHADLALPALVERLERLLREFRGVQGFEDDISMLVIERAAEGDC